MRIVRASIASAIPSWCHHPSCPDGQRIHIAESAVIEIARVRMVKGVAMSPEVVGRECQHSDDTSDPVIRETTPEE